MDGFIYLTYTNTYSHASFLFTTLENLYTTFLSTCACVAYLPTFCPLFLSLVLLLTLLELVHIHRIYLSFFFLPTHTFSQLILYIFFCRTNPSSMHVDGFCYPC